MDPEVTRMTPRTRKLVRIGGVALTTVGGLLVVGSFLSFMSFGRSLGPGSGSPAPIMLSFLLGGVLLVVGVRLLKLGFLGVYADVVATETQGAVTVAAGAAGRGLARHLTPGGGAREGTVKVRCRACGSLESEHAQYCSQCGASMR